MQGQPAKVLRKEDVRAALRVARKRRHAVRDEAMVLLSVHAGLRACEIASLTWRMVLSPTGKVGDALELPPSAAKMGSGRRVPLHRELKRALVDLHAEQGKPRHGPVIASERGDAMTPKSVVNWFRRLYDDAGLTGCSSHSGRRTFVTRAARTVHRAGGSLRDVQELAGHRSIKTTEGYIEGDRDAQRRLIQLL
ncbi:site-specific integrase [Albimonas sp. CAU 1670]|uniref:tyrosine-type recombinase/integrase n=1 Tax=Albimonas sp. CAU 1670 TaxID=3032599 RepID=UPI0023DA5E70|nr:site-specific integrase [Albimonas sp. CAU 1670]MDF2232408.1 site-specific integrase [Albimonas sp. CAU 1670]